MCVFVWLRGCVWCASMRGRAVSVVCACAGVCVWCLDCEGCVVACRVEVLCGCEGVYRGCVVMCVCVIV